MNTVKQRRAGLFAVLLVLLSGCASFAPSAPAGKSGGGNIPDAVLFSTSFAEWAEIRIRNGAVLFALDNHPLNWGEGTIYPVPSGRHTLSVGFTSGSSVSDPVTMECTLLPGKSYVIKATDWERTEREQSNFNLGRHTAIRTSAAIELEEYGAAATAIPARNESIIEINLAGSWTTAGVDDKTYLLSAYDRDAAEKLRVFVPAGKHAISSSAVSGVLTVDIAPNRFLSYTVNTGTAALTQTADNPLNLTGVWAIDIYGDGSLVYVETFGSEGYGWVEMYDSGVREIAGSFTYTFTDKTLTIKDASSSGTMEYTVSPDGNTLYLNNFLGVPISVTGIRQ
jgi:hypothetical protein